MSKLRAEAVCRPMSAWIATQAKTVGHFGRHFFTKLRADSTETIQLRERLDALERLLLKDNTGAAQDQERSSPLHRSQSSSTPPPTNDRSQLPLPQSGSELPFNIEDILPDFSLAMPTPNPSVSNTTAPPELSVSQDFRPVPQTQVDQIHFDFGPLASDHLAETTHQAMEAPEEQSHGTLMLTQGGRSKYLGPTAASEWLKDVSLRRHLWLTRSKKSTKRRKPRSLLVLPPPWVIMRRSRLLPLRRASTWSFRLQGLPMFSPGKHCLRICPLLVRATFLSSRIIATLLGSESNRSGQRADCQP